MLFPAHFMTFMLTSILIYTFTVYVKIFHYLDIYRYSIYDDIKDAQVYDYIIVGGGSAGATVTARLAEDGWRVLLVEAGGYAPPFFDIPLLSPVLQRTPYDWQYSTTPQTKACRALHNNQSRWAMGKILGGSSRLNYMAYVRGHPSDYYDWYPDFVEPVKDKGGPMRVSNLEWNTGLANAILEGIKEMHLDVRNINEDSKTGFMKVQLSMEKGRRWSSDKLLYENAGCDLTVVTHAFTTKVLTESREATGIEFVKLNKTYRAFAKKGVILSAGAIGTPKILLLSGIGPRKDLEDLRIKVINDLPVGQHLVDHILTGIDLVTLNISLPLSVTSSLNPFAAINYFFFGEGPWTSSGIEVVGTFHSSFRKDKSVAPDLQLMGLPLGASKDYGIVLKETMGITEKVFREYFDPLLHENAVTIAPVLLHPKSSGFVKLQSTDPFDHPLINPNYLSHADDVATLIDGLKFVTQLVKTKSMKRIGARIYGKQFPGCEDKQFASEEYWECYIRHLTLTSYHPAGTCRVGQVVDSNFKVFGMTKLYVVDASVLPSLPSGNINAAVIMVAVKASQAILNGQLASDMACSRPNNYCTLFNICGNKHC